MTDLAKTDLDKLVDDLTLAEQVSLLSGEDFWSLPAIDRLGIGKLYVTDGPNGARGGGSLVGGVSAAAFPVGIAIGASWNPDLAREIGSAIADEVKSKGAHVSLAPTVNIQRSVTNGRNFECYSEDPELTAALAVGYVQGLQAKGISATVKHFAGNESEIERTTINSEIDERALREVYLRPFEDAVKKAGAWGIMSSYNKLNGTYTAENEWLLTDVLRDDWGFDGIVMSDWFGSRSTAPTVNAGLDLEMPGPTRDRGAKLVAAVEAGEVSAEMVRGRALNMLRLMQRTGALHDHRPHVELADNRPEHRDLIRRAGAEGAVLLTNNGILPLPAPKGKVAVIGPNAKVAQIMGGGSAQLNPHYSVSPWQGLVARLGEDALTYAPGCTNHRWEPVLNGDFTVEFFTNRTFSGTPAHVEKMNQIYAFWFPPIAGGKIDAGHFSARITGVYTPDTDGIYHLGMHSAGFARVLIDGAVVVDTSEGKWSKGRTFFEEGNDEVVGPVTLRAGHPHQVLIEFVSKPVDNLAIACLRVGIARPLGEADIAAAVETARTAETVVIFAGRSGEWDTEGSDLQSLNLPGLQDRLIAEVARVNPRCVVVLQSGGPVEMPWLADVAAVLQAWYPGQEAGNSIADVLFGDADPGGRLAQTFPVRWQDNPTWSQDPEIYPGLNGKVRYEEGLFIGHRHYDKHGIAPLFPFGFGLSYTSFEMDALTCSTGPEGAVISLTVTNTGLRAGFSVVQIYVGDVACSVPRPERELKGFAKLHLAAGESRNVNVDLPLRSFAYFDTAQQCWQVEAGAFRIEAGFSVADIRATQTLELAAARLAK